MNNTVEKMTSKGVLKFCHAIPNLKHLIRYLAHSSHNFTLVKKWEIWPIGRSVRVVFEPTSFRNKKYLESDENSLRFHNAVCGHRIFFLNFDLRPTELVAYARIPDNLTKN